MLAVGSHILQIELTKHLTFICVKGCVCGGGVGVCGGVCVGGVDVGCVCVCMCECRGIMGVGVFPLIP